MGTQTKGIPCMWMRGGSSKGGYFLASDVPAPGPELDALMLRIMGSPDPRQIDGMGGGSPLTSKVAIVGPSSVAGADLDYRFLQVFVDEARVSEAQPCGNILAGVGPFALERGLVAAEGGETELRIHQVNTGAIARVVVPTPEGLPRYDGQTAISGVPGTGAGMPIFVKAEPGKAPKVFPTGEVADQIDGVACTLVDAGMPSVVMRADAFGLSGQEAPDEFEADEDLRARVEAIRLKAGPLMGLGDVSDASVPKMVLVSAPADGTQITTRCFIPKDVHRALGVLCGVSIVAAMARPGSPAAEIAALPEGDRQRVRLGHPTGALEIDVVRDGPTLLEAGTLRTARKLMDGKVFP